jgi:hypothetical protein
MWSHHITVLDEDIYSMLSTSSKVTVFFLKTKFSYLYATLFSWSSMVLV